MAATSALAFPFEVGDLKGSFDTTLTIGGSYRVQGRSADLIGRANGGNAFSINNDNGNLNYDRGFFSTVIKGTHDLHLSYGNFGAFVRASWFYDHVNENQDREFVPLTQAARDRVGKNIELLDAFAYAKFDAGGLPWDLRIGSQVINWGESTFIPNGINVINPVDLSRLRVPGAELREALRPTPMIYGSVGLTEEISFEAFYLFLYGNTRIDPSGTYFSGNDFAGFGGSNVYLAFGRDPLAAARATFGPFLPRYVDGGPFAAVPRDGRNFRARDDGQFGLALRWLAPEVADTEFSFYFMNYHSRLPIISAQTPATGVNVGQVVTNVQTWTGSVYGAAITPTLTGAGITGAALATAIAQLTQAQFLNNPAILPASLQPFFAPTRPVFGQVQAGATAAAQGVGLLNAARGARYIVEYPEDIKLAGVGFNTSLGGIALQGELSYKWNQPLQVDDVELLFAALSSLSPATFGPNNQLGTFGLNTYIPGFRRHKVWQGQVTGTKVFGPMLGAQQLTLLGEIGAVYVPDLPDKNFLRYDGPGTVGGGSRPALNLTGNPDVPAEPADAFADKWSWGYQLLGRLDYTNLVFGANVSPRIAFSHDVDGVTPLPLGNFRRNRMTLTFGAEFVFQQVWSFDVAYTNYFGGGRWNLINDRDFVSANLKYSF